jgi:hypothetical protein
MRDVVLPQAFKIALAPTVGYLVQIIKGTSLAAIIGFTEVTRAGQIINNATFQPLLVFRWWRPSTSSCAGRCRCWPRAWSASAPGPRADRAADALIAAEVPVAGFPFPRPNQETSHDPFNTTRRAPPLRRPRPGRRPDRVRRRFAPPRNPSADIKKKGEITIGMLVDFPPYGTTNAQNQPDGYDADVAKLLAKDWGVKANIVPVTGPNRIPFLLTNKVDLLVASLAITPERAKQVQFSTPYCRRHHRAVRQEEDEHQGGRRPEGPARGRGPRRRRTWR